MLGELPLLLEEEEDEEEVGFCFCPCPCLWTPADNNKYPCNQVFTKKGSAMDGSYHLTADPPTSYNSLMCADVALDLNNQMRPALWSQLLSMWKDWPDLDEDSSHLSPTCTEELPDHEPLRRGKRRK
jgi:hypothetical protein